MFKRLGFGANVSSVGGRFEPQRRVSTLRSLPPSRIRAAIADPELRTTPLAYELIQGSLVRYSSPESRATRPPSTALMVHGILGSKRNLQSMAKRIVEAYPQYQILLVDLRNHGDSNALPQRPAGPHTVSSAAGDVLSLLRQLKVFPNVLIGHSFGGKVVMSMVKQFGNRVPFPVSVWVLDTLPGSVRVGGPGRRDHPLDLIQRLKGLALPIPSRQSVVDYLQGHGFSEAVARWMSTNLRPAAQLQGGAGGAAGLSWMFDLHAIEEMYRSYEEEDLWPVVRQRPQGIDLNFVKAERSTFRWEGPEEELIQSHGCGVHLCRDAGHWLHTDNPDALFSILSPSFGGVSDEERILKALDRQIHGN